ncbi:MAG TPA: peptide ABC transporter substrate-binding protein [Caulobacteraceae bacterium]|nr:peptide ABC transporter substrate-binding protein [Caulobacteraceae bacterium]
MRQFRNLFLAAVALAAISCSRTEAVRPACPAGEQCLHIGNASEPVSLDPHKASGTWENRIISDMLVGLTTDDASGKPIPGAAESWTTSADGLTWTFRLRPGAVWSDGAPVTSEDFVFSLRRIMDPKTAAEYASLLYPILNAQEVNEGKLPPERLGVRAVDPLTLEIRLKNPAPFLPELATHYTMYPVPSHKVKALGDAWVQPGNYVSNGPYTLAAWRLGDHVKTVKNPRFWDAGNVCIDQVYYYPTNNAISAQRRVFAGELDVNTDIQSNQIGFLRENPKTAPFVRVHTYLGTAYLAFNSGPKSQVKALKDRRVRQALSMAIDRDFITKKLLRGGQQPAYSLVPPGVANYVSNGPKAFYAGWPLEKRQREARRLLAEAGYGPDNPLKLEIKHRNTPDPSLMMPAIQADFKAVGVQAVLVQNETQIAYQSYRIRDFDIADAAWIADYNDAMSFLYLQDSSTGPQNYGDYANPAFDALLAKANNEPDAARRAQYMAEAERIMLDDAPIAPIFYYVNKNLVNTRVTGWVDNIVDKHRTRYLCLGRSNTGG